MLECLQLNNWIDSFYFKIRGLPKKLCSRKLLFKYGLFLFVALETCIRELREKPLVFESIVGKNLRTITRDIKYSETYKGPDRSSVENSAEWSRLSFEL